MIAPRTSLLYLDLGTFFKSPDVIPAVIKALTRRTFSTLGWFLYWKHLNNIFCSACAFMWFTAPFALSLCWFTKPTAYEIVELCYNNDFFKTPEIIKKKELEKKTSGSRQINLNLRLCIICIHVVWVERLLVSSFDRIDTSPYAVDGSHVNVVQDDAVDS